MREILFHGKRRDNGEWVEGDLSHHKSGKVFIKQLYGDARSSFEVDPETVGEFTGKGDADRNRIWEGDIAEYRFGDSSYAVVEFRDGQFSLNWLNNSALRNDFNFWCNERDIRVIGNIHDNKKEMRKIINQGDIVEREDNER